MDVRKPSGAKKYQKYRKEKNTKGEDYNFYERVAGEDSIIEEFEHFAVVENKFPYQIWDGFEVEEHFLVVPKRFVESLGELSEVEKSEYAEIISKYESLGYSVYSRSPVNVRKTVKHQHTHLISLNYSKPVKVLFNIAKKILWWR